MGVLSVLQASVGFLIVAAASLIDFTSAEDHDVPAPSHEGKALAADWLVEAVVSGLPDAVIALDRRGIVVGSNAAARQVALLNAQSAAWERTPPDQPVAIAGTTAGSSSSTTRPASCRSAPMSISAFRPSFPSRRRSP